MSAAGKEHLRLTETAEWASIELPPKPPGFRFRGGARMDRLLAYAGLLFLALVDLGAVSLISRAFDARLYGKYPLDNALNILIACCYAFGGLCIIAPIVAMNVGYFFGFFPRRIVIQVCDRSVVEHILQGPRHRIRRFDLSGARWAVLAPPQNATWAYLQQAPAERSTRILIQSTIETRKGAFEIAERYPPRLARNVAETLAKQISQRSTISRLEVADTTDPAFLNQNDLSEPIGCDLIVERSPTQLSILAKPVEFKFVVKIPLFHIGLWCLVLPPLIYKVLIRFVPLDLEPKPLLMIWGLCAFIGGVFVLPFILLPFGHLQWLVTADGIERISGKVFTRRRHWAKTDIASIGVLYRRNKKDDRYRAVLELNRTDGKRDQLAVAHPFVLRYMASLMRSVLGAPAAPPEAAAPNIPAR